MTSERLFELLMSESPRWLGEATHHLSQASLWVREGRSLSGEHSPLVDFYRCIHAFKGACSLMTSQLPLASRILERLHGMEGLLAIKDRWKDAPTWISRFKNELAVIREELQQAWQESCVKACQNRLHDAPADSLPEAVYAQSGSEEFIFPWGSILEFIPGAQVRARPFVPVQGELVAVISTLEKDSETILFGIAVQNQAGQKAVVPIQKFELLFQKQSIQLTA